MPKVNDQYVCDHCNKIIEKGTGFTFPNPDYFLHQTCYKQMKEDARKTLRAQGLNPDRIINDPELKKRFGQ